MKQFSDTITLVKNGRGVWDLDPTKGCASGISHNPKGCYGSCFAAAYSYRYGYDFSKTVLRDFENEAHEYRIINQINKIDSTFIRMGVSGDPSENWEHTIKICKKVAQCNMVLYVAYMKAIVIITKHWNDLTDRQLSTLSGMNVCINTSVSALDEPDLLEHRLTQYDRLKGYCKSVLRIVSCDFNTHNATGKKLDSVQCELFDNDNTLDNILRVSPGNELVLSGLINIERVKFLSTLCYVSLHNKHTYFGKCSNCPEMCGLTLKK